MRTWRGAAVRSRCGQRLQDKLGRRQSTAVYGGPAVMRPIDKHNSHANNVSWWNKKKINRFVKPDLRRGNVKSSKNFVWVIVGMSGESRRWWYMATESSKFRDQTRAADSGVNGSVTVGDGLTRRGRYPGGWKSPSGVQGRRPNSGSSGRIPQADTYFGNGCKTATSAVNCD